jgi:hypothetical protein
VKDYRGVIHYDPELKLKYEIDFAKYFDKFFVKKVELIDESLHYRMFLQKTQLIDTSTLNIERRIKKAKMVMQKLGE